MVAVFNKELLSWYLITLKLRETVESGVVASSSATPSHPRSIQFPDHSQESQPHSESIQKLQLERHSSPLRIIAGGAEKNDDRHHQQEEEWVIAIKERLEQARHDDEAGSWEKLSIYRVPHYLREGDDKAYVPQTVSLGPYHHGKRRLRHMDRHKWRSLRRVLDRSGRPVESYLDALRGLEERARACYEGPPVGMSSDEFAEMMLLDGCFVLELFRGAAGGFKHLGYARNDPVFAMRGSMHSIQRDMVMLENQIPLFVLDRLLELQLGAEVARGLLPRLALRFFDPLMPTDEPLTEGDRGRMAAFDPLSSSEQGGLHCLEVFRRSLLRRGPQPEPRAWMKRWSHANRVADKRRQQLVHCVTELREAGVKFRRRRTDRFWDVRFGGGGVLEIPRLLIHDGTKSLFLNLIAFEQCHLDCSNDITSYVIFMDNLINSPQDVGYLHYCGIIEHWLGSDAEVADLFNRLCQEVVYDINDSYLSRLSEDVNRYYNHRWNAWRASLRHNYFSNPWAIVSFVAAVVLLLLTFVQSFFGVYAYYYPSH